MMEKFIQTPQIHVDQYYHYPQYLDYFLGSNGPFA